MKRYTFASLATLSVAGFASADHQLAQPVTVAPAPLQYESGYSGSGSRSAVNDFVPPAPTAPAEAHAMPAQTAMPAHEPAEFSADSCGDACCGDALGCGSTCNLGDPFTLKGYADPCDNWGIDFGGWTQLGFHTNEVPLSNVRNDGFAFNDRPGQLNLHQQWLWVEKVADGSCGWDWGFRFDFMYGTDASATQSFGNPVDPVTNNSTFDNDGSFDRNGGYGFAIPQLYGELAYGDWNIIAGHFYTLIGYEVVTAPDNFFYSHALTMFNSEPFTHTGVLATYSGLDNFEVYGGWTLGWDTGFDSNNGGSSWLGGFSTNLTDDIAFTYISTAGNFGARSINENNGESTNGYSHSLVFDIALSDNLNYVFQSDLVAIEDDNGAVTSNDQVGVNQYLLYTINDCWAAGARLEWWKSDGASFQEMTYGLNYRPHANLVLRPEIRYDWTASDNAAANINGFQSAEDYNRVTFGMDAILTY